MISYTEIEQIEIGKEIANIFKIKKIKDTGMYNTKIGSKTPLGIFNTLIRINEEIKDKTFYSSFIKDCNK
jgi:hypothetical protein